MSKPRVKKQSSTGKNPREDLVEFATALPFPTTVLAVPAIVHASFGPRVTQGELRVAVEQVLGAVSFAGLSLEYCKDVASALELRLPGAWIEVFHRHRDLVVRVRTGTWPDETRFERIENLT